ncbi:hypothetical protein Tco_0839552 [Tanacetum coccineum]|uniref:Uncharacterized protein n=1 Tax=Tanacetum coccineum TaxID=301880 RepID=A0ABQ5AQX3_9ASTR
MVDAYETDKDILETYGDTVMFKRRRDDEDEDEEPSAGSNRESKRRRAGKEPKSTIALKEKTSNSSGKSKEGSKSHQKSTGKVCASKAPIHAEQDMKNPHIWIRYRKDQPIDDTTQLPDNDDKLYTFKEGDENRLRLQDIENMLLLLVQGKLTNLNVEERLALGVSLRMFTRSIVLRRHVEDFQLGNKDKKKRLMPIDELHKFSDGTLNYVRSALDDILKRIRMEYLP